MSVAFSADNRQIVSGSRDKTIKLWNTLAQCKYTIQVSFVAARCVVCELPAIGRILLLTVFIPRMKDTQTGFLVLGSLQIYKLQLLCLVAGIGRSR